jgi:enoyl-CoA hydratase
MAYETLIYEKEDGIAIITLNRPQRMNALSEQLVKELGQVINEVEDDEEVRVVIMTGQEKFFCAGADIREPVSVSYLKRVGAMLNRIESSEKPWIAAVSGIAYGGGCELSLLCDLRIASDTAQFAVPEVKIGAIPAGGGTQRLPRLVGATKAKELLFLGDPIDANEAYRIGLVNEVVPAAALMEEAKKMARLLIARAPVSLRMVKHAVDTGLNVDLKSGLAYEAHCAAILLATEDFQEGIKAFSEKRKPTWKGR